MSIVVFGSFNADLTGRCPSLPVAGETLRGSSFKIGIGGKGTNQAVAAHRAGADVTMIAKVGDDLFGGMAKDFYRENGMSLSGIITDPTRATGTALILVDEKTGQNEIVVIAGTNGAFTETDIESARAMIENADILLAQLETNFDALEKVIKTAYDAGKRVILNPAPAAVLSPETLKMVDTITPNETEAMSLTGVEVVDFDSAKLAADMFFKNGIKNVIITMGENGAFISDGTRAEMIARVPVKAVDTVGAGDTFNGALAAYMDGGTDIFTAAKYANCAGAISVTRIGAADSAPDRAEIDALYRKIYGGN